jgi:hypothetical protein
VELNNIYINTGANSGNENYEQKKKTSTSGKLITAVYASYGYVYIFVQVSQLPEDGLGGPKHVETNIRYFNVNFKILYIS